MVNCVIVFVSYFHLFISFKCSFECELNNVPLKDQFIVVCFLWSPYGIGQTIYIFMLWFVYGRPMQ